MAFIQSLPVGATRWLFDDKDLGLFPECEVCLEDLWEQDGRSLLDEVTAMRAAARPGRPD